MTNVSNSLASVDVGGRTYPMVTETRCKTCCHPLRLEIEKALAEGKPYSAVLQHLVPDGALSERNLRDHLVNQHMPAAAPAVRQIASEQAEQALTSLAPMVDNLVGHLAFAQRVVDRVQQRLAAGDIEPSISDGLAAAKLLAAANAAAGDEGVDAWRDYYCETFTIVKEVMNAEDWAELTRRMNLWSRQHRSAKQSQC